MRWPWNQARSIRHKLIGIVLATTFLALTIAGVTLVILDLKSYRAALQADLITQADLIGTASAPALAFQDEKAAHENLLLLEADPSVTAGAIYSAKGALFAGFLRDPASAIRFPTLPKVEDVEWGEGELVVHRRIVSHDEVLGTVYLRARDESIERLQTYLGVIGLVMAVSLLVALLLTNRLQASLTDPILAISGVARQVMESRDFSLRAVRTTEDEVGLLVDAFNDMLKELGRRAETLEVSNHALQVSEERYQLAVRGSSAGLWDWNILSRELFLSPRFRNLLGYDDDPHQAGFSSIFEPVHPEDRSAAEQALEAHWSPLRTPYRIELRMRTRSDRYRWFFLSGEAVRDHAGRPYRMAGSIIDITERKVAEAALQEANRRKDDFIATLAHELRNPLAPIRTGLKILVAGPAGAANAVKAGEIIERQLTHMVRLVDDLLDISRITSAKVKLEMKTITIQQILEVSVEASSPHIAASNQRLLVEVPDQPIHVSADLTRMAQAVGNILNNASKYTPPDGQISLMARREGDQAVIRVSDNGSGIPVEMLDRIFEMFTQVGVSEDGGRSGLGLGLSIVRQLIALHAGTVQADSEGPGKGSTFTIRLPCVQVDADGGSSPAPAAEPGPVVASLQILVVDDNVDAASTMTMLLQMSGHRTAMVHNGLDVVDAARRLLPDVILLDIGLPGMNGYQVASQLRRDRLFDRTLLVALTGWGSDADKQAARQAGLDVHLTKPVGPDALTEVLAQARPPARTKGRTALPDENSLAAERET